MRHFCLSALLAITVSAPLAPLAPLAAQRLEHGRVAMSHSTQPGSESAYVPPAAVTATNASTGSMIVGGVIGGALGLFAGVAVGVAAENCAHSPNEWCGLGGGLLGGLIGEAIGVPVGVNFAAGGKGTLGRSAVISLGVSTIGLMTAVPTYGLSVLAIPPFQILTSIKTERRGST